MLLTLRTEPAENAAPKATFASGLKNAIHFNGYHKNRK
jgi:hypothetical protein